MVRGSNERTGQRRGGDTQIFEDIGITLRDLLVEARACQLIPRFARTPEQEKLAAWYRKNSGHPDAKRKYSGRRRSFASKSPEQRERIAVSYIRNQHRSHLLIKAHGTDNRFEVAHLKKLGLTGK